MSSTPSPDPVNVPGEFLSDSKGMLRASSEAEEAPGNDKTFSWNNQREVPMALPVTAIPLDVPPDDTIPMAVPVPVAEEVSAEVPLALPVEGPELEPPASPPAEPISAEPEPEPEPALPVAEEVAEIPVAMPPAVPASIACPACTSENPVEQPYCSDCGYYFSQTELAAALQAVNSGEPASTPVSLGFLNDRYERTALISERKGVRRYRGLDSASIPPETVIIVEQALPQIKAAEAMEEPAAIESNDEILPSFDDPPSAPNPSTQIMTGVPLWPTIAWERRLLRMLELPSLPQERDYFCDDTNEYLILEVPVGQALWDAWDDPESGASCKFKLLTEVAETLQRLHQSNAMLEGLRPDIIVVDDEGKARISDISDLLPLPYTADIPVRGGLYSAPELISAPETVDARADLYSFGAMLYALHVGRELNEKTDFDGPGKPKPFIPRFPDIHPGFGRLMMKTFRREVDARFPTDEASKADTTGFSELIRTLDVLGRTYDNVRLEVACWTSTGIIRTGNEDAFAILHAAESRQDDLGEAALVILCDGMGGYEAGEVAAAMTIQSVRKTLSQIRPFSVAAGESPFLTDPQKDMSRPEGHATSPVDVNEIKKAIKAALRDANKLVFQTSRTPGSKRRGMGCTAEVVYIDGRNVIVGHVGDSRTYHLSGGRLVQLTRDQTLVNRLVELGSLTAEEAETHPRRNELQQAIGGQPDVEPGLYHGKLEPGDWVVVCSDGLTNHVTSLDLEEMLRKEAYSAETAARRLVNLTLIEGATDNVTVVAVRAT